MSKEGMVVRLNGLDCAACAQKIEIGIRNLKDVEDVKLNLFSQEMRLSLSESNNQIKMLDEIKAVVSKYEPDVVVSILNDNSKKSNSIKLRLKGLDCANCAQKIKDDTIKVRGVALAKINLLKEEMAISIDESSSKDIIIEEVKKIVNKYEPDVNVSVLDKDSKDMDTEEESFSDKLKKKLWIYGIGLISFMVAMLAPVPERASVVLYITAYLIFGVEVILTAVKNIARGQMFDEYFLMSIATVGAIVLGDLFEAVFVMIFYQIGETFQSLAVEKSRKSIKDLMNIRSDFANVERGGNLINMAPEDVNIGDIIVVKPGEKIPLDGTVTEGKAQLDTLALTGESLPRRVNAGDEVLSGSINTNGVLKIRVIKEFSESTVVKILEMVENASEKKSRSEQFITKFARVYTPAVVLIAVLLAVVPILFIPGADLVKGIKNALVFLVVSCPCALVLSVPLGFFSGIGEASRKGILVKGSNYIQALSEVKTIVMDKTGTLTKGVFEVSKIQTSEGVSKEELLRNVALVEKMSNHPIAKSIVAYCEKNDMTNSKNIEDYKEIGGNGVYCKTSSSEISAGNERYMDTLGVDYNKFIGDGSVVYVAKDGKYLGYIVVSDIVKADSAIAIKRYRELGIGNVIMLTGDNDITAGNVAKEVGIDVYYSKLLPQDKVAKIDEMYEDKKYGKVAFVGDGINDAPVLSRVDVGIAMGGIGSDATIEAADVVLMSDEPSKIADAIIIARNTNKIVKQNIVFSLLVKGVVLCLGAFGVAGMLLAIFADVGVALLAVLNSMRKKI